MLQDRRVRLLARHLVSGTKIEDELALLTRQSEEKQRAFDARLRAVDAFLASEAQSIDEADAAAAELGVSRRQLYRLLAKMREVGPVRALTPGLRTAERPAPTKSGLSEAAEAAIRRALDKDPTGRIAQIQNFVREALSDAEYPGDTALRRRIHALRRMTPDFVPKEPLGAHVLVDQVALDLSVKWLGSDRLSVVTMIIDRGTKFILGFGLTPKDGAGVGLEGAILDLKRTRLPGFRRQSLPVARCVERLTWIVPPGLEGVIGAAGVDRQGEDETVKIEFLSSGPRRHGDAIFRYIGDRIGPYPFRRVADLGADSPRSPIPGIELEDARWLVSQSVGHWNARILEGLAQPAAQVSKATQDKRLGVIVQDIERFFGPVLATVAKRQEEARFRESGLRGDYF